MTTINAISTKVQHYFATYPKIKTFTALYAAMIIIENTHYFAVDREKRNKPHIWKYVKELKTSAIKLLDKDLSAENLKHIVLETFQGMNTLLSNSTAHRSWTGLDYVTSPEYQGYIPLYDFHQFLKEATRDLKKGGNILTDAEKKIANTFPEKAYALCLQTSGTIKSIARAVRLFIWEIVIIFRVVNSYNIRDGVDSDHWLSGRYVSYIIDPAYEAPVEFEYMKIFDIEDTDVTTPNQNTKEELI